MTNSPVTAWDMIERAEGVFQADNGDRHVFSKAATAWHGAAGTCRYSTLWRESGLPGLHLLGGLAGSYVNRIPS